MNNISRLEKTLMNNKNNALKRGPAIPELEEHRGQSHSVKNKNNILSYIFSKINNIVNIGSLIAWFVALCANYQHSVNFLYLFLITLAWSLLSVLVFSSKKITKILYQGIMPTDFPISLEQTVCLVKPDKQTKEEFFVAFDHDIAIFRTVKDAKKFINAHKNEEFFKDIGYKTTSLSSILALSEKHYSFTNTHRVRLKHEVWFFHFYGYEKPENKNKDCDTFNEG